MSPQGVGFYLASDQEKREASVVHVTLPHTTNGGEPLPGGVEDPAMGSNGRRPCTTCGGTTECPGHPGHIELHVPVIPPHLGPAVAQTLRCLCHKCGKFLLRTPPRTVVTGDPRNINLRKKRIERKTRALEGIIKCRRDSKLTSNAWDRLVSECKNQNTCDWCDTVQRTGYTYNPPNSKEPFTVTYTIDGKHTPISPKEIRDIFDMMTGEDLALMGYGWGPQMTHPRNMVWGVLTVPPPCIRPSTQVGQTKSDDNITGHLSSIVKLNGQIAEALANSASEAPADPEAPADAARATPQDTTTLDRLTLILNVTISTFVRDLAARIRGKKGRVRGNLEGKRVDQCGRSVIANEQDLSVDQIGVPRAMAMTQSILEPVNLDNIELMRRLVTEGPGKFPGAKGVLKRGTGYEFSLRDSKPGPRAKHAQDLEPGDVVERHLFDGDVVLFNRQPSLHRGSMMAARVKVVDGLAFKFPSCVCAPYNADFDGDEMNMYTVPPEDQVEILMLAGIANHILTPKDASAIVGPVQDAMLALYVSTLDRSRVDRTTFERVQVKNVNFDLSRHVEVLEEMDRSPDGTVPARRVLEVALPRGVWVKGVIENGAVVEGVHVKSKDVKRIIEAVVHFHGPVVARDTIDSMSWMLIEWFMTRGATMGVHDIVVTDDVRARVRGVYEDTVHAIDDAIGRIETGELRNNTIKTMDEFVEETLMNIASRADVEVERIVREAVGEDNNMAMMVTCGSKGKPVNMRQIMGFLGQQVGLDGRRIVGNLPHLREGDRSARACGFIGGNFRDGLSPIDFWFHAVTGRQGLMATALKTATTGYLQRRLVKACETLTIASDGTVVDTDDSIVSLCYGDDGFEGARVVNYDQVPQESQGAAAKIAVFPDRWRKENESALAALPRASGMRQFAFDFEALVRTSANAFPVNRSVAGDQLIYAAEQCVRAFRMSELVPTPNPVGRALAWWWLCPTTLKSEGIRLGKRALDTVVRRAREMYLRAIAEIGTAVGLVSMTSIGEPLTQLTLNVFHTSGTGQSSGIERLLDLLSGTHPKSVACRVYLAGENPSREAAEVVAKNIRKTTLRDITVRTSVVVREGSWALEFELDRVRVINLFGHLDPADPLTIVDVVMQNVCQGDLSGELRCTTSLITDDVLTVSVMAPEREGTARGSDAVDIANLRAMENALLAVPVHGLRAAGGVSLQPDNSVMVSGQVLQSVMAMPGVDATRTVSDDMVEIAETLGIHAAEVALVENINAVMNGSVAERHIKALVKKMTKKGGLMPINRHGINRQEDLGPMSKASFEQTVDMIVNAGVHNQSDNLRGVSASIMVGKIPSVGTGVYKACLGSNLLDGLALDGSSLEVAFDEDAEELFDAAAGAAEEPPVAAAFVERAALSIARIPDLVFQ